MYENDPREKYRSEDRLSETVDVDIYDGEPEAITGLEVQDDVPDEISPFVDEEILPEWPYATGTTFPRTEIDKGEAL